LSFGRAIEGTLDGWRNLLSLVLSLELLLLSTLTELDGVPLSPFLFLLVSLSDLLHPLLSLNTTISVAMSKHPTTVTPEKSQKGKERGKSPSTQPCLTRPAPSPGSDEIK
jgi:hypothetical protein